MKRKVTLADLPEEALLSIPEVASLLRMNVDSVRQLVATGELKSLPIGSGRELRVPRFIIKEFLRSKLEANAERTDTILKRAG